MARTPSKILLFKKLTQVGRTGELALGARVSKKMLGIAKQVSGGKLSPFARPYVYVALATCLEADIKYKFRAAMELAGGELDAFRKLYEDNRIDIELLFHVISENISLADLVADGTSVSDVRSLVGRSEILINAMSGEKFGLRTHLKKLMEESAKSAPQKLAILTLIDNKYDTMMRDIDVVFQIRHAVVHDALSGQGPVRTALNHRRMQQVTTSCMAFQALLREAFVRAAKLGSFSPKERRKRDAILFEGMGKELKRSYLVLQKKYSAAENDIKDFRKNSSEMLRCLGNITRSFRPSGAMSPELAEAYIRGVLSIIRMLLLEDSRAIN